MGLKLSSCSVQNIVIRKFNLPKIKCMGYCSFVCSFANILFLEYGISITIKNECSVLCENLMSVLLVLNDCTCFLCHFFIPGIHPRDDPESKNRLLYFTEQYCLSSLHIHPTSRKSDIVEVHQRSGN